MHKSNVWLAGKIIGDRVRNSAGENLGKIEELVVDPATGQILYGVLSFGGFLGMGNKLFAIPWSALNVSAGGDYLLLDLDKEVLERAPGFDRQHWPDMADRDWQTRTDDYYGAVRPSIRPAVHQPVYREPVRERERTVVVEREVPRRKGMGVVSMVLLCLFLLGLGWFAYIVQTRGWEQAKSDFFSTAQGAAYAMKETSADATLTAKVKTAFSLSKRLPSDSINVDSKDGIVTLRGEVPTGEQRNLAESLARDVAGVREIHNHLYVMNGLPQ